MQSCLVSLEVLLAEPARRCLKFGLSLLAPRSWHSLTICSLDNDIIVLRGGDSEAASQILKGVVVLCLPAALKVEDVHLRMTGQLKIG